jgi:pyruvate dehydrogenase E1 component alpha subunit
LPQHPIIEHQVVHDPAPIDIGSINGDVMSTVLLPREAPVQLVDAAGVAHPDEQYKLPAKDRLLEGYRSLVIGRRINDQCNALVRQGRLAVYPSSHGQEACQVAAVMALAEQDWIFPTYRDSVAVISRGVPAADAMVLLRGDWHSGYDPTAFRVATQSTPLATQLLHAVGFAHAAKLKAKNGEHSDTVVLAMCGDGATSEGDFHEAMNFAAVFHLPVVFFVQNNEFAISVPLSRQTAAPSLAHKAIGYGMPGERVDGNDLPALVAVLDVAVARARKGGGPTLIEAHTYRMQAHTNADDDTRYRERADVQAWVERDPLTRMRAFLTGKKWLTAARENEIAEEAEAVAAELRTVMNEEPVPDPEDLFRYVYAERTAQLSEQWDQLSDELSRGESTP